MEPDTRYSNMLRMLAISYQVIQTPYYIHWRWLQGTKCVANVLNPRIHVEYRQCPLSFAQAYEANSVNILNGVRVSDIVTAFRTRNYCHIPWRLWGLYAYRYSSIQKRYFLETWWFYLWWWISHFNTLTRTQTTRLRKPNISWVLETSSTIWWYLFCNH